MTRRRAASHTVACSDASCAHYRSVFHTVRHFEQFTQLELGMLAETTRTLLPRLAKTVHGDHHALHHFLANAEWSVEELRAMRLRRTREALAGRPCVLCLDETGDRKQGHTTDSTASQYLGGLHRVEQGSVSVNAYGVLVGCWIRSRFRSPLPCLHPRPASRPVTTSRPRPSSPSP